MTGLPALLYQGQPGTSVATVFTNQAQKVKVKEILLANTTTSAKTVTIHRVPKGGTAGVANQIVPGITVPGNGVVALGINTLLEAGDFLAALQGTASAITVTISGELITL